MPEISRPTKPISSGNSHLSNSQTNVSNTESIVKEISKTIEGLKSLKEYPIRKLVNHAEKFGQRVDQQMDRPQFHRAQPVQQLHRHAAHQRP